MRHVAAFGVVMAMLGLSGADHAHARSPEQLPLALAFDLDGVSADADYVVADTQVADKKTDYVVGSDPDVCRPLAISVTDNNNSLTAGTVTVTGTDCLGDTLTATYTFDGSGTGAYPLRVAQGAASGPYFQTVSTVENDALTGEGRNDTIAIGFVEDCPTQYVSYGVRESVRDRDAWVATRTVNPFKVSQESRRVTTSGALSTSVTSVKSDGPFDGIEPGDLVWFSTGTQQQQVQVTAKQSDDAITVSEPVSLADDGVAFEWQARFVSSDPADDLWIGVGGYSAVTFLVDQDAEESTGDTIASVECSAGPASIETHAETLDGAASVMSLVNLAETRFERCRLGLRFGTGDDGDPSGDDLIHVVLMGTVR